jgi:thiamine biosynthesis lipoprotein
VTAATTPAKATAGKATAAKGDHGLVRRAEPVMGTVVSIHVRPGSVPMDQVYLAIAEARARLHRADAVFSTWKEQSPVSRLRRGELGLEDAPPEVAEVLRRAAEAKERSGGWFDPWAAPGGVDPTGMVKGWAAARALASLRDSGVAAAMVNAGGDAALWGEREPGRPWRIGIQNPFDRTSLAAVLEPASAVATSGSYERGRHVFDPFTGRPASAVASATVTGPDLDMADALATALLAGGDRALAHVEAMDGYEALLIGHDGSQQSTPGLVLH